MMSKLVCLCVWVVHIYDMYRREERFVTGRALYFYCDLNFSPLRSCRFTIVTAPLAKIIRGHEKLDVCCIKTPKDRWMNCAPSLHSVHQTHTMSGTKTF